MKLNVINNYKTIYYNFLASFYLCLNSVLPYYDDVIISIQSQAIKLLIDNNSLNMKKIKKIRMIEFIDTLDKSDKIILDKEKDIIVVDYCIYKNGDASDASDAGDAGDASTQSSTETEPEPDPDKDTVDTSDPDKDPYEPCKKKSRIDNDYIPRPAGPAQLSKDKDDYYNIGIYTAASAVSAAAAAVANNAAKYLLEDSEGNTTDATDTTEATDTADAVDEADTADAADAAYSADAADAAYTKEGYGYDLDNEIDESFRNIIQNIVYDKNKDD